MTSVALFDVDPIFRPALTRAPRRVLLPEYDRKNDRMRGHRLLPEAGPQRSRSSRTGRLTFHPYATTSPSVIRFGPLRPPATPSQEGMASSSSIANALPPQVESVPTAPAHALPSPPQQGSTSASPDPPTIPLQEAQPPARRPPQSTATSTVPVIRPVGPGGHVLQVAKKYPVGLDLREYLDWGADYDRVRHIVEGVVANELDHQLSFTNQDPQRVKNVRDEISRLEPWIARQFKDGWPIDDFIKIRLKYTNDRIGQGHTVEQGDGYAPVARPKRSKKISNGVRGSPRAT